MARPVVEPEKIHLLGIRIIKEYLECSNEFLENPAPVESLVFGHDYSQFLNLESSGLRSRLYLRLGGVDQSEKELGLEAEYGLEFHFVVENLRDFAEPLENEVINLKGGLAATIAGISYSTARGIIWGKLRSTALAHIVLPVINPNDLLKQAE